MAQWPTAWPNQAPGAIESTFEGGTGNPDPRMSTSRWPQAGFAHEQNNAGQTLHSGGQQYAPGRDPYDMTQVSRALVQSPGILHIRNQLSDTQSRLSDAISQRIRTPDSQVQTARELNGKIEKLQHEVELQAMTLKQYEQKMHHQEQRLYDQEQKLHEKDATISALSVQYNNAAGWQTPMLQAQTLAHQPDFHSPASVPGWSNQPHQYGPPPPRPASGPLLQQYGLPRPVSRPLLQQWNSAQGQQAATPIIPAAPQQQLMQGPTATVPTFPTPGNRQRIRPDEAMVDERGSPMHRRGLSQNTNPFMSPNDTAKTSSNEMASIPQAGSVADSRQVQLFVAEPPSRCSDRAQSVDAGNAASVALSTMTGTDDMRETFQELIDDVTAYAYTYVNWPTTAGDKNLPQYIKDIITDATHPKHAHRLLKTGETRYFVISKIMLEWMWKNILHPESLFGLDEALERAIRHHREQTKPESCAASVRYVHLSHISAQFQQLLLSPGYSRHLKMLIGKRTSDLFAIIQPMAHMHKPGEWDSFQKLIHQAHKAAEKFFSGHTEYWWKFPDMRDSFSADTMTNLDKSTHLTPAQMEEQHIRVRVASTPYIKARKTHKDGRTIQIDLIKAGILPNYVSADRRTSHSGN